MFGEEEYETSLRELIRVLGIEDRVELRGFQDDLPSTVGSLDVVVHCSVLPEPFGQVIVEAMAAGRPVIAAAEGGPLEIIEVGTTGLLHPPGNVDALAETLRSVAADPALRARLSDAGRRAARRYSPERAATEFADVWEAVVGAGADPR
jgi:glycosyltransferase involved in cell wall biosynthesis